MKEYLASVLRDYGTIMFAYGCGSIKKNGIYGEVLKILQKEEKHRRISEIMHNPS